MEYVWGSANPAVEGWPTNGQLVTWRAFVKNWMTASVENVAYAWYLDGSNIASGTVSLSPTNHTTVDCPWVWTFDRHELTFAIDPEDAIEEFSELNNRIQTWTDAITVGFWVEQTLYDYFHQYQKDLGIGANSWEDWAQRHVARWNEMFELAVFGNDTPSGVMDRIRLGQINIVPDDALPLSGSSYDTNMPDYTNRTVDLQWGFPETNWMGGCMLTMYGNHTSISDNNAFYFEGSLLHELGHARYLIDTYGFNVHDNDPGAAGAWSNITITVNGEIIVGTPYMPLRPPWWDSVYFPTVHGEPGYGLMSGPYTLIDHYGAAALNLIDGHRAWKGNYNSPQNIGVFKNDLPDENRFTVRDGFGNLLTNAVIKIYQSGTGSGWYAKRYDNIPDVTGATDTNGQALLGRCPFDTDGTIEHGYGKANGCAIMRVEQDGRVGFGFFNSMVFNMNYWRGVTNLADYEIYVPMIGNEFGIAGTSPLDGHVTPFSTISQLEVVVSGTNGASSVRINGSSASYQHGKWRRSNVSLSQGSNTFTIIATAAGGARDTQTVTYIRKDVTPPTIGKDSLLFPYPGAELTLGEQVQVRWTRQRITDEADGENCVISTARVVRIEDGVAVELVGENLSNNGSRSWTPSLALSPGVRYALRFDVRDTSMNVASRTFVGNLFYVVPEPGEVVALLCAGAGAVARLRV